MPNFKLIFANNGDNYYCRGLMKLDLNSYVRFRLHSEDGFDEIFFIEKDQDGMLKYIGSGEKNSKAMVYSTMFLSRKRKKIKEFSGWMNDQLKGKKSKNAIVFEIGDFCDLAKDADWREALGKLSEVSSGWRGSIVLIIPPIVAQARYCLMYEDIFSLMKDNSLLRYRNTLQPVRDYFAALKDDKGHDCEFYNLYTYERIQALFDFIVFREGKWKFPEGKNIYSTMIEYFVQYLNNRFLQWKDNLTIEPAMLINPTFSELHSQLIRETVWRKLTDKARMINGIGGVEDYLKLNKIEHISENSIKFRISYDRGSYAHLCMGLSPLHINETVSDNISNLEKKLGYTGVEMINNIYAELNKPWSRSENEQAVRTIDSLLPKLSSAAGSGDEATYRRVLYCIQSSVYSLCVPKESDDVLVHLRNAIDQYTAASSSLFMEKKRQNGIGVFEKANSRRNMAAAKERLLDKLDSLIVSKVQQTLTATTDSTQIAVLLSDLAKGMDDTFRADLIENNEDSIDYSEAVPAGRKSVYHEKNKDSVEEEGLRDESENSAPPLSKKEDFGNSRPPSFYF